MPRSGTGVVWPALADHQDNPQKASRPLSFRLLSLLVKGNFQGSFSCRVAAPRSMKTASPLGQGGTSGGFWGRDRQPGVGC